MEPMIIDETTGKCRLCKQYSVYDYQKKQCVPIGKQLKSLYYNTLLLW